MFTNNPKKLILIVAFLSALSFNHAFNFHLFWDDWYQILGVLYYPEILNTYINKHPISILEFKFLSGLFKFNPYLWQFLGYLLKIIDSLSMWPLIFILTNSKKAAFYSCLIFAVFGVGIESVFWASAQSSAMVIPLINLSFYFWIKSTNWKSKGFFIGLLFFNLSMLAEPGRAFMAIILACIWEFLSLYQNTSLKNIINSLGKITFLFSVIPLTGFILNKFFSITPDVSRLVNGFSGVTINNLIYSLKNLLFGWLLIPEQFRYSLTIVFILSFILILILFMWQRIDKYKIILFLSFWLLLFYLTNYLGEFDARSGEPMEHRYYAISAVGLVGLLSYGLSFIKSKYINWIVVLFLAFNIYITNSILMQYSAFRSIPVHDKIWGKIDKDVPQGETGGIFMFSGADFSQRARILDWNDSMPFATNRGFVKKEDYPFFTNDLSLIIKLVCEKNVIKHSTLGDIIQKEPIPLTHIHAWELKNGELINRSGEEIGRIKTKTNCLI